MRKKAKSKLIRAIRDETDERVIDRVARKPPSPEFWNRMPRWKQRQIVLIAEYYAIRYRVKVWVKSVIGKAVQWISQQAPLLKLRWTRSSRVS